MNLPVLIATRPLSQPSLERHLVELLSEAKWTLTPQAEDGRLWLLRLAADPCSELVQKMLQAVIRSDWFLGMDFSHQD